jgi:hypothetical protein
MCIKRDIFEEQIKDINWDSSRIDPVIPKY